MSWLRLDTDFAEHPQIEPGGFAARVMWIAILTTAKRFGAENGTIPSTAASPAYLGRRLGAPPELVAAGLDALTDTGAIVRCADGAIAIPGWRRYQPDPTAAARQRRRRHGAGMSAVSRSVTVTDRDAPLHTVSHAYGTGRDGTGQNVDQMPSASGVDTPPAGGPHRPAGPRDPDDGGAPRHPSPHLPSLHAGQDGRGDPPQPAPALLGTPAGHDGGGVVRLGPETRERPLRGFVPVRRQRLALGCGAEGEDRPVLRVIAEAVATPDSPWKNAALQKRWPEWLSAHEVGCPDVDLGATVREAFAWAVRSGGKGRKRDLQRFLGSWFSREQDRIGRAQGREAR